MTVWAHLELELKLSIIQNDLKLIPYKNNNNIIGFNVRHWGRIELEIRWSRKYSSEINDSQNNIANIWNGHYTMIRWYLECNYYCYKLKLNVFKETRHCDGVSAVLYLHLRLYYFNSWPLLAHAHQFTSINNHYYNSNKTCLLILHLIIRQINTFPISIFSVKN